MSISTFYNLPVGTVVAFAGSIIPLGWLLCDGRTITQASYPELYSVVGTKIPDLRGQFVRGLDNGKGIDVNRVINSEQGDAIRNIKGEFHLRMSAAGGNPMNSVGELWKGTPEVSATQWIGMSESGSARSAQRIMFDASRVVPTGTENRPKNIALNYIIKAKNVSNEIVEVNVAEQLNEKIENVISGNRNISEIKFLWTGTHQANGTITLNEEFDKFAFLFFDLCDGNGTNNTTTYIVPTSTITTNNSDVAGNGLNDRIMASHYVGNGNYYGCIYFRDNKKDIYIGDRVGAVILKSVYGYVRK